ncbi:MAG: hypothetical protein IKE43_00625 [Coriobacteriales bacterium]|nr:hypothetical protein [Coriobacteriales bacterium]
MTIDLNNNGKDDIEELLEDMHKKFDELDANTEASVQEALGGAVSPIEEATGMDINGDGVIGAPKAE